MLQALSLASISAVAGIVLLWLGVGEARLACSRLDNQAGAQPKWSGAAWRMVCGAVLMAVAVLTFLTIDREMRMEPGQSASRPA